MWRYRKASTDTRTVHDSPSVWLSLSFTTFFMFTVHRSTHLQICFKQKIVHAFFFTLTLVTCITNRGLLYFVVLTQDSVIFTDIPLISSLCNSPKSLLQSSFKNPKFLRVFSDLARTVIRWHSFIHIRLSKLWKVKVVINSERLRIFHDSPFSLFLWTSLMIVFVFHQ